MGGSTSTVNSRYSVPFEPLISSKKSKNGSFKTSVELSLITVLPFSVIVLNLTLDKNNVHGIPASSNLAFGAKLI